jgi:hypothetical protein
LKLQDPHSFIRENGKSGGPLGGEEKQVMKLEREEGLGIDPKVEHRLIR